MNLSTVTSRLSTARGWLKRHSYFIHLLVVLVSGYATGGAIGYAVLGGGSKPSWVAAALFLLLGGWANAVTHRVSYGRFPWPITFGALYLGAAMVKLAAVVELGHPALPETAVGAPLIVIIGVVSALYPFRAKTAYAVKHYRRAYVLAKAVDERTWGARLVAVTFVCIVGLGLGWVPIDVGPEDCEGRLAYDAPIPATGGGFLLGEVAVHYDGPWRACVDVETVDGVDDTSVSVLARSQAGEVRGTGDAHPVRLNLPRHEDRRVCVIFTAVATAGPGHPAYVGLAHAGQVAPSGLVDSEECPPPD